MSHAEDGHDHSKHDHAHHGHLAGGYELGVSAGFVHLEDENEDALGVHLHIMKPIGSFKWIGDLHAGLGYEYIFSDDDHYAATVPFAIYPWRNLMLAVAPGIQWVDHADDDHEDEAHEDEEDHQHADHEDTSFVLHLEAAYVFPCGKFDWGPVVEYSFTDDEEHYMIGLHLGFHL
jgi:hypothetical protein